MGTGGVGNQLYNITKRLHKKGYKIKIISLSPLGRFGKKTAEIGIDVESLNFNSRLFAPVALYAIKRSIQNFNPDIVHTHLFHASIIGRLATIGTAANTITTIHNTFDKSPDEDTKTSRYRLYSVTDRFTHLTTFVSDAAHDRYLNIGVVSQEKSRTVYNGIDTHEFCPKQTVINGGNEFVWIIIGNLQEQKDHRTLLKAVAEIKKSRQENFRVQIIGEGKLRHELESLATKLDINSVVDFEGRVENVPEHLHAADAFVLSSRWEGFGLVVAEAMACELPVVATNTGGPSEIIEDGKTGFLAEKGCSEDLAVKMTKMMNLSSEERSTLGIYGRQRIKENYNIKQIVLDWENIYEKHS